VVDASLLRYFVWMRLNVDHFRSQDPSAVVCDNIPTLYASYVKISVINEFIYFIEISEIGSKVHGVRTSKLWRSATAQCLSDSCLSVDIKSAIISDNPRYDGRR